MAQNDEELARSARHPNQPLHIEGVTYDASNIVTRQHIATADGAPIHYHLLSFSHEESRKVQRAFSADGFVRITDISVFESALLQSLAALHPTVELVSGSVRYYDPLEGRPPVCADELFFLKPLEFGYQQEYRIILRGAPNPLKRFEIGILVPRDCFEYVIR